jgi:hypothetical protein
MVVRALATCPIEHDAESSDAHRKRNLFVSDCLGHELSRMIVTIRPDAPIKRTIATLKVLPMVPLSRSRNSRLVERDAHHPHSGRCGPLRAQRE